LNGEKICLSGNFVKLGLEKMSSFIEEFSSGLRSLCVAKLNLSKRRTIFFELKIQK